MHVWAQRDDLFVIILYRKILLDMLLLKEDDYFLSVRCH